MVQDAKRDHFYGHPAQAGQNRRTLLEGIAAAREKRIRENFQRGLKKAARPAPFAGCKPAHKSEALSRRAAVPFSVSGGAQPRLDFGVKRRGVRGLAQPSPFSRERDRHPQGQALLGGAAIEPGPEGSLNFHLKPRTFSQVNTININHPSPLKHLHSICEFFRSVTCSFRFLRCAIDPAAALAVAAESSSR